MEKKKTSFATTAFLLLILSCTEVPPYFKYPMLLVTTISFILTAGRLYNEYKAKKQPSANQ